MTQADTDVDLLEKIQKNDPRAFDAFVSRYGDRLYGFSVRMCGEREDARDTVQDTLLQAYRSLKTLKEPKALRSWLYRVASNACLMKRRKGKFEPERELSLEELMPAGQEGLTAEIPDTSDLPEEGVLREETRRTVQEAIRSLPPHYRVVLVMRDMEHLSTKEVSGALDLPVSTVKMRLHRARLGVRKYLESAAARLHGDEGAPGGAES
jgi:RNA polymerase sigma-70 factor (ECF subfamily)